MWIERVLKTQHRFNVEKETCQFYYDQSGLLIYFLGWIRCEWASKPEGDENFLKCFSSKHRYGATQFVGQDNI